MKQLLRFLFFLIIISSTPRQVKAFALPYKVFGFFSHITASMPYISSITRVSTCIPLISNFCRKYSSLCILSFLFYVIQKKCNNLEKKFKANHEKLTKKTHKKIKTIQKKQEENNQILENLIKNFDGSFKKIDSMNNEINTLHGDTATIKSALSSTQVNINQVNVDVENIKNRCTLINEKIHTHQQQIKTVEELIKNTAKSLLNTTQQIALLEAAETEYAEKINTFNAVLEDHIKTITTLNDRIHTFDTQYKEVKNVIDGMKKETNDIKNNMQIANTQNTEIKKLVIERCDAIKNEYNSVKNGLEVFKTVATLYNTSNTKKRS